VSARSCLQDHTRVLTSACETGQVLSFDLDASEHQNFRKRHRAWNHRLHRVRHSRETRRHCGILAGHLCRDVEKLLSLATGSCRFRSRHASERSRTASAPLPKWLRRRWRSGVTTVRPACAPPLNRTTKVSSEHRAARTSVTSTFPHPRRRYRSRLPHVLPRRTLRVRTARRRWMRRDVLRPAREPPRHA
jgi:hypothetical protein